MNLSCVTLPNDPARKLSMFRIVRMFPAVVVPASPAKFAAVMAVIGAPGASPPMARGTVVGAMPASYPSEFPRRISPPILYACLPFDQLRLSPYVQRTVVSRYELVLPPPISWLLWKLTGEAVGAT